MHWHLLYQYWFQIKFIFIEIVLWDKDTVELYTYIYEPEFMHTCMYVPWTTQYTIENKNLLGVIENIIYTYMYNYNYCHTFHYQGERRKCGNH